LKTLLFFIDGIGIGRKDKINNPFFFSELKYLPELLGGDLPSIRNRSIHTKLASLVPADARLGVDGLPQSGTGQTSIFCGVNAPKIIGKHFGPYPYSTLRPVISEKNIFSALKKKGKKVFFANAYPKQFFEYIASGKMRLSVTTLSCMMAGVPLMKSEDLRKKKAVSADITIEGWKKFGYNFKSITSFEAGKRLYKIALKNDFTVFEYFHTDHAGHSMDKNFAKRTLEKLDGLIGGLLSNYDSKELFIIIISDHGNLEDISVKTHTLNPVPVILIGKEKERYAKYIKNISDVYNLIIKLTA
jgi:2,3-bisphosphoglycerate-independent phosphoglycerate mutase